MSPSLAHEVSGNVSRDPHRTIASLDPSLLPGAHLYTATSLIRNRHPVGPYSRAMPRVLGGSYGGAHFLMDEVPRHTPGWGCGEITEVLLNASPKVCYARAEIRLVGEGFAKLTLERGLGAGSVHRNPKILLGASAKRKKSAQGREQSVKSRSLGPVIQGERDAQKDSR